jgi:hypothetical protein
VIAQDLAGETNTCESSRREPFHFSRGVRGRLSVYEFNAAGCAAGIAATGVQDIHAGLVLNREYEPLSFGDLDRPEPFNCQIWHTRTIVRDQGSGIRDQVGSQKSEVQIWQLAISD